MADDSVQRPSERRVILGGAVGNLPPHPQHLAPHRGRQPPPQHNNNYYYPPQPQQHYYNNNNDGNSSSSLLAAPPSSALLQQHPRQCLTWSRMVTAAGGPVPPPRSGAASVVVKGKLFVFGGYGGGTGRLDDFWSFDFETNVWEQVPVVSTEKPGSRENNGVVISDSSRSIYLFGGYNGDCWLNDLWKYDIETKCWTCIQESSGPIRVSNGDDHHDPQEMLAESSQQPLVPTRRFGYVSVVHDGKFVLFGGFDGSRWLNDMYVFDFLTATWTQIQARGPMPSARSCPAWAKSDTHVYIQGGYDGVERKSDFFALDLQTYTWTEMPCLGTPPSPRYFHACCLFGNRMYLYGGYSGSERLADMFAYDFDTNHWSQIDCSLGDAPSGRSSLVAQVYENSLYVFGGYNGNSVLNDFYRFRLKPIGVPPPALVSDFQRLINNPDVADVRFVVEGKEVYAHKAILAIRSEYFRVMLCGGMRESTMMMVEGPSSSSSVAAERPENNSNNNNRPIELPDISHSVFLKVLEFLYTDSVRDTSLETSLNLLIASEQFMLDRLKAICEDLIRRDIGTETVVSILVASHRHHASGLKEIAFEFILRHLNDPHIMSCLSDLKAEPDLLLEIIRRSNLANHNPAALLQNAANQDLPVAPFGSNAEWNGRR